ncbi:hypothetical protein GUA87_17580 [Sneathiella sp. P13V-1]|uniref:hypothetical protein n=1 Tax=Sneathiella sp. P13V-1 TaxID=2697366 RepID=UPI00187B4FEB|nr:hypothetical protein [Sneathiella sp. P13V-1]MBE7638671.1 hypothetical protein [Sneathiella sp. P13V-1]
MFENKLEEAAKRSRQQMLVGGLIIAIIALAAALFVVMQRVENIGVTEGISPTQQPLEEKAENSSSKIISEKKVPTSKIVKKEKVEPQYSHSDVLEMMTRFEKEFEETLSSDSFGKWAPERQKELLGSKKKIVDQLARKKIDDAFTIAADLLEKSSNAISEFNGEYQSAYDKALSSYQADNFEDADFNIKHALALKPTSQEALELRPKIEQLQKIVPLIEQAESAATENNLEQERLLSLKIVELDPSRTAYVERAKEITEILKNQAFERSIARGYEAARKEDLRALDKELKFAEKLFKDRAELQELRDLKKKILKDLAFEVLMSDAEKALASENWQAALTAFQGALQLRPDDGTVAQGVELASAVLKHEKAVQNFLNEPERLTNEGVKANAEAALKSAAAFTSLSKQLTYTSNLLKKNIEDYNMPVEIVVRSDKKTHVSVKGVGQVGVVDEYKIRLKPGQYVFEGRREGFRVKAVSLKVKPGDSAVEVVVIVDERI